MVSFSHYHKIFIAAQKLNRSLRKFIFRKLRLSLLNAVNFKEIEQVGFWVVTL